MGWWNSREPQPPAAIEPRSYPSDTLQAHIPGTRCGGCHCGAVRFEVKSKAPKLSVWCHCRNCQRISGGPVMAWATIPAEDYVITRGKPSIGEHKAENATRRFCRECGTPLSFQRADLLDEVDVTVSSFDDGLTDAGVEGEGGDRWRPQMHIWTSTASKWCRVDDRSAHSAHGGSAGRPLPRHAEDPARLLRIGQQEL